MGRDKEYQDTRLHYQVTLAGWLHTIPADHATRLPAAHLVYVDYYVDNVVTVVGTWAVLVIDAVVREL